MKKIWFRVGMEANITDKQYEELLKADGQLNGEFDARKREAIMRDIIKNSSEMSGETYIVGKDEGWVDDYDNPDQEIMFDFFKEREVQ